MTRFWRKWNDASVICSLMPAGRIMTTREPKIQMHAGAAWQMLAEADHTLMTHDLPLTGEKLWRATVNALKALYATQGWEYPGDDHIQLLHFAKRLAAEREDENIKLAFLIASHCHANFKYDWMEFDDLDENRVRIRRLVEKILADVE